MYEIEKLKSCLRQFLSYTMKSYDSPRLWFIESSKCLYEIRIPNSLPKEINYRLKTFRDISIDYGSRNGIIEIINYQVTENDICWALSEAMNLLLEIDKFYGIEVEEAEWK